MSVAIVAIAVSALLVHLRNVRRAHRRRVARSLFVWVD